jgi:general secretion pathway protein L
MLRHTESFGARVVGVSVDPPEVTASSRLDLLPVDRPERASGSRWQVVVPALLVIAAILTALVLPVWQKREEAIALNQQSDQARQRAGASDALRIELERRVGEYNFALERKYAFPGTVQALDDITHLLPDDTWLTQLELRSVRGKDGQRELTLRGESANAGKLVSLLEDSKLFTQAAPGPTAGSVRSPLRASARREAPAPSGSPRSPPTRARQPATGSRTRAPDGRREAGQVATKP